MLCGHPVRNEKAFYRKRLYEALSQGDISTKLVAKFQSGFVCYLNVLQNEGLKLNFTTNYTEYYLHKRK